MTSVTARALYTWPGNGEEMRLEARPKTSNEGAEVTCSRYEQRQPDGWMDVYG